MKYLTLFLALLVSAASPTRPPQRLQRLPMQKKHLVFKSPVKYEKRILRHDAKTGQPIYYDPKPQVRMLEARAGKYAFTWIGYDGKAKEIIFQRADAIDAVVSASVSRTASGQYLYLYRIKNLPSSGAHFSGFAVQTFASGVRPLPIGDGYAGPMSKNKEMREGNWIYFGSSNFKQAILPGRDVEVSLISSAPPGLVECRVHGGELGLKGVGEDMPQELENVLPSYEDWPSGYTVGPNANLTSLSIGERLNDVRLWLPQFVRLGWMTPAARRWYEQNLTPDRLGLLRERAGQDLKAGNITTEVHAIIQAIR